MGGGRGSDSADGGAVPKMTGAPAAVGELPRPLFLFLRTSAPRGLRRASCSRDRADTMKQAVEGELYHFCVVCPDAQQVYLVGAFNGWSTTATPMVRTEESVWQLSLKLIEGGGAGA